MEILVLLSHCVRVPGGQSRKRKDCGSGNSPSPLVPRFYPGVVLWEFGKLNSWGVAYNPSPKRGWNLRVCNAHTNNWRVLFSFNQIEGGQGHLKVDDFRSWKFHIPSAICWLNGSCFHFLLIEFFLLLSLRVLAKKGMCIPGRWVWWAGARSSPSAFLDLPESSDNDSAANAVLMWTRPVTFRAFGRGHTSRPAIFLLASSGPLKPGPFRIIGIIWHFERSPGSSQALSKSLVFPAWWHLF